MDEVTCPVCNMKLECSGNWAQCPNCKTQLHLSHPDGSESIKASLPDAAVPGNIPELLCEAAKVIASLHRHYGRGHSMTVLILLMLTINMKAQRPGAPVESAVQYIREVFPEISDVVWDYIAIAKSDGVEYDAEEADRSDG